MDLRSVYSSLVDWQINVPISLVLCHIGHNHGCLLDKSVLSRDLFWYLLDMRTFLAAACHFVG